MCRIWRKWLGTDGFHWSKYLSMVMLFNLAMVDRESFPFELPGDGRFRPWRSVFICTIIKAVWSWRSRWSHWEGLGLRKNQIISLKSICIISLSLTQRRIISEPTFGRIFWGQSWGCNGNPLIFIGLDGLFTRSYRRFWWKFIIQSCFSFFQLEPYLL